MGNASGQTDFLALEDQFRMYRLQVFNWGTFDQLHDIPISKRGFLIVGRSGSGKTTLLDGFSTLLVPPKWVDFNAAARESDRRGRDRNLVSYVRGAWAEQKDDASGEIAIQYLRTGTTWSALALSFSNMLGRHVVLIQLFWLRGHANANADLKRHYLILERPFDLRELETFDLDIRRLKQSLTDGAHFEQFNPYCERFRSILAIENEMALRLLHKTQSAKNLGDLNTFLREFMLDKPETFDVAERLVGEFAELNEAHQAVVTARRQVQTLAPARVEHEGLIEIRELRDRKDDLRQGMDPYRASRRVALQEERIEELRVQAEGLAGEVLRRKAIVNNHMLALRDLQTRQREQGGERIERLEAEKSELEIQRTERFRKREQAGSACRSLNCNLPDSPQEFADLIGLNRREIEQWQVQAGESRDKQLELAARLAQSQSEFADKRKEVESLRRQPSNIPARMLELRHRIATDLGWSEERLPFAGELIEVIEEEAAWRGAIERVLHSFALSVLVEDRHYAALSTRINAVNLGERLVYFRAVQPEQVPSRPVPMNSLARKLRFKESRHEAWLKSEISRHFDYACVDSMQAFRQAERALTREGQVRHGKSRHEKDDRRTINDRGHWVLGFDNRDKLAFFERQAQELAVSIDGLNRELNALKEEDQARAERMMHCQTLVNIQWQEIDVVFLIERIAAIDAQLDSERKGNEALREIGQLIEDRSKLLCQAEKALGDTSVDEQQIRREIGDRQADLHKSRKELASMQLTERQHEGLDALFTNLSKELTLENLDNQARLVERGLNDEIRQLDGEGGRLENSIKNRFADFKREWQADAADMNADLASASEFFALLQRLETDNLPAYEHRFFDLLQNQSRQNLAALNMHMQQARREIVDRMNVVNESLDQVEFNKGTTLNIKVSDRQLPEVREFKQEIQKALSYGVGNVLEHEREQAEQRFTILSALVKRLGSQESEQRRWRDSVLDVRQHVEFIGVELNAEGREIEVYRSGAGKSGGQRQKLATTCLAAALRYQLGGMEQKLPTYAPVILDEAFDKADNEFTTLAMNIFINFGFQMIVATPLKSVMTLEPFIGGACFVEISDRRHSGVMSIEYDEDRQRLKLPEQTLGDTTLAVS